MVKGSLDTGPDWGKQCYDTCLKIACSQADTSIMKLLIDHGVEVNTMQGENGSFDIVITLIGKPSTEQRLTCCRELRQQGLRTAGHRCRCRYEQLKR